MNFVKRFWWLFFAVSLVCLVFVYSSLSEEFKECLPWGTKAGSIACATAMSGDNPAVVLESPTPNAVQMMRIALWTAALTFLTSVVGLIQKIVEVIGVILERRKRS